MVEQGGRVEVLAGQRRRGAFLDISDRVLAGGERGLFSIAFADYRRSRRFYVYYTDETGDLRIDEFKIRRRGQRPRARRGSRRTVLRIPHREAANHNGGQLQMRRRAGLLFIATGDGGVGQSGNAQDKQSLLGKLLRIDPRRGRRRAYRIPRGNPFRGRDRRGRGELYSRGLRNPWRFSFDRNRIVIADVGESSWEEVNYERIGRARGANFGWDRFEGNEPFNGGALGRHDRPVFTYSHSGGRRSITGGYVVRDPDLPALRGRYLYGDLGTGEIRSLRLRLGGTGTSSATGLPNQPPFSLWSFGMDARRNVYVVAGGAVHRIVPG